MDKEDLKALGVRVQREIELFRKGVEVGLQNDTETIEALSELEEELNAKKNRAEIINKVERLMNELFGWVSDLVMFDRDDIENDSVYNEELLNGFGISSWHLTRKDEGTTESVMTCEKGVFNDLLDIDILTIKLTHFGYEEDYLGSDALVGVHVDELSYERAVQVLKEKTDACGYCMQALKMIGDDNNDEKQIESREILLKHIFKNTIDDEEWKQALMMAKLSNSAQALLDYCVNSSGNAK